jgi:manganese-dependent inorganic pyrophosphatase
MAGRRRKTHATTLVIGHQRPDTDSAVAAVVYSQLLNKLAGHESHEGVTLDDPGPQARWLFAQAGVSLPRQIEDVFPTVRDIMLKDVEVLDSSGTLGDAIRIISTRHVGAVPVLTDDGTLEGILSDRLPNCNYFYHFNVEDFLGVLFELKDLVKSLGLQEWNAPGRPAHGHLTLESEKLEPGDVLLCGDSPDQLSGIRESRAAAVIVCSTKPKTRWKSALRKAGDLGVYRFKGSLMALVSQLTLCIPARNAMATDHPRLTPDQPLHDVRVEIAHAPYPLPVVTEENVFQGLVGRTDLLAAPKPKVVLVDHFETHQAAPGIDEAEIVEIVDHHRVGTLETHAPIRVDCRPLGSTATIIACKFDENGLRPYQAQARLLLGAMISDTLLLTSPTTTAIDRQQAVALARRARVDLREFGREVLVRNDETLTRPAADLLDKDLKEFSHGKVRFAISQIETVDRTRIGNPKLKELGQVMRERRPREGWSFLCVLVTDVLRGDSLVLIDDEDQCRRAHLLGGDSSQAVLWPDCVSRKKQFLPAILKRLEEMK